MAVGILRVGLLGSGALRSIERPFDVWSAIAFFRATLACRYRAEVFWWESATVVQRLLLTGYACLIPNSLGVVRITMGMFVSIVFSSMLIVVQPYKRVDLNNLATTSNLIQTCGFIAAVRSVLTGP